MRAEPRPLSRSGCPPAPWVRQATRVDFPLSTLPATAPSPLAIVQTDINIHKLWTHITSVLIISFEYSGVTRTLPCVLLSLVQHQK